MQARRALAVYLVAVIVVYAGVVAYKGYEAYAKLPAPEPTVLNDVRVVNASPDRVFVAMSDIGSWERIDGVERVRLVPGSDPPAVEVELSEWLISITMRAEHEVRPPGYQQLRVVGGYLDGATITQQFKADGAGTQVTTSVEADLRAFRMVSGAPEQLVRDRLDMALTELAGQVDR